MCPSRIRSCPPPRGTTHSTGSRSRSAVHAGGSAPRSGTLLGEHIAVASTPPAHLWQARLVPQGKPYPGFHRIHGVEVVPISVLLQTLSAAAAECGASTLSDVRFERPIVVDQPQVVQVVADGESVTVSSAPAMDTPSHRWIRHVSARISHWPEVHGSEGTDSGDHEMRGFDPSSVAELQAMWGIEGQPFPWSIGSCRSTPDGLHADVDLRGGVHGGTARRRRSHRPPGGRRRHTPIGPGQRRKYPARQAFSPIRAVRLRYVGVATTAMTLIVDIAVKAPDGRPCVDIRGLRYADVESGPASSAARDADPHTMAHAIEWQPWGEHADRRRAARMPAARLRFSERAMRCARCTIRLADAGYTAADLD